LPKRIQRLTNGPSTAFFAWQVNDFYDTISFEAIEDGENDELVFSDADLGVESNGLDAVRKFCV